MRAGRLPSRWPFSREGKVQHAGAAELSDIAVCPVGGEISSPWISLFPSQSQEELLSKTTKVFI